MSTQPSGYDDSFLISCSRGDCQVGVGLNKSGGDVTAFLVQLQYAKQYLPIQWTQIARFDHNPSNPSGHDIFDEGLHIDIVRKHGRDIKIMPAISHLPRNLSVVIDGCINYFDNNAKWFKDIYDGSQSPSGAPKWTP